MKISVCNLKGGSGKSTLTMLLTMAIADSGRKVGVIDLDVQESSLDWIEESTDDKNIVSITDLNDYQDCDVIIYDTPPALTEDLASVVKDSDITLIPCEATMKNIKSARKTSEFIKEHSPKSKRFLVFNKISQVSRISKDLTSLASVAQLKPLKTYIPHFEAYKHADIYGWKSLTKKQRKFVTDMLTEVLIVA